MGQAQAAKRLLLSCQMFVKPCRMTERTFQGKSVLFGFPTFGHCRTPGLGGWCRGGSRYAEGQWGFPQLKKFQSSKVPKPQSFKVSKYQSAKVSKFRRFIISKTNSVFFWKILIPYHHIPISCFLEAIDPIFNMFKHIWDFSARLF